MAFREKMGLVTIILGIMAFVGFLTFGFTQVVCPRPPLSFRIESMNSGYVVIHGWAYLLSSWNDHPPISGITDKPTSVIYEPINAGGKDASFLFQKINQHCASIITPKASEQSDTATYFPCQLIENNQIPSSSDYSNKTACHLKPQSHEIINKMRDNGVLNSEGHHDKAGRVYYDWNDINSTSHLAVYNR